MRKRLIYTSFKEDEALIPQMKLLDSCIEQSGQVELLDPEFFLFSLKGRNYAGRSILGFDTSLFSEFKYIDLELEELEAVKLPLDLSRASEKISSEQLIKLGADFNEYFLLRVLE